MTLATELFTEVNRLTQIVPASRNAVEITSAYVSMRDYHKATAIVQAGAIGVNGVVDAYLVQATDTTGAGAKLITGKAITALDDTDDNNMAVIELDTAELDIANGFDCIALTVSHGGAVAILSSALLVRHTPRFAPVGTDNLAEVVN